MSPEKENISIQIATYSYAAEVLAAAYLFQKNTTYKVTKKVYLVDCNDKKFLDKLNKLSSEFLADITFYSAEDLVGATLCAGDILTKYKNAEPDKKTKEPKGYGPFDFLRWGLKPSAILANLKENSRVIYHDPDIIFVSNCDFLWDMLDFTGAILTPHNSNPDPNCDSFGLLQVLRDGLFNAGFVGAGYLGVKPILFWEKLCKYKISVDRPFFVDQKYLDLLPVYYPKDITVLNHAGCNVGPWNIRVNDPGIVDGKLVVHTKEPIVFFHNSSRFLSEGKIKRRYTALSTVFEEWNNTLNKAKECLEG